MLVEINPHNLKCQGVGYTDPTSISRGISYDYTTNFFLWLCEPGGSWVEWCWLSRVTAGAPEEGRDQLTGLHNDTMIICIKTYDTQNSNGRHNVQVLPIPCRSLIANDVTLQQTKLYIYPFFQQLMRSNMSLTYRRFRWQRWTQSAKLLYGFQLG